MVIWNEGARTDLATILVALITWKKHASVSLEEADKYIEDIEKTGNAICKLSFHSNAIYDTHKVYGNKVYRYERNKRTQWYIIYNWDKINKIAYVNKIVSNYHTVAGTA